MPRLPEYCLPFETKKIDPRTQEGRLYCSLANCGERRVIELAKKAVNATGFFMPVRTALQILIALGKEPALLIKDATRPVGSPSTLFD